MSRPQRVNRQPPKRFRRDPDGDTASATSAVGEPAADESSESQESSSGDSSSEQQQQPNKKAKMASHTSGRRQCPHGRQRKGQCKWCGGGVSVLRLTLNLLMDGGATSARAAEGSASVLMGGGAVDARSAEEAASVSTGEYAANARILRRSGNLRTWGPTQSMQGVRR